MSDADGVGRARERKYRQVNIRVSPWEWDALHRLCEARGLTLTEFVLASTVYAANTSPLSGKDLRLALAELRAQGINLNQAMRLANTLYKEGHRGKARQAISDITDMKDTLRDAINAVTSELGKTRPRRVLDMTPASDDDLDLDGEDW